MQSYAIPQDPSDPYLRKWIKPDDNPIAIPDYTMNGSAFRDPTTAWFSKDGHWRTVVGSLRKHRGIAYIYRSRDFKRWVKAKHPVHSKESTGMWEGPDLFPVSLPDFGNGLDLDYVGPNIKHVLKVSLDITRFDYYTLGKYDRKKDRYVPDGDSPDGWDGLRFDYGNFYASKTFFYYKKSRRILWGWANESDTPNDDEKKGWAGRQRKLRGFTFKSLELCNIKGCNVSGSVGPFGLIKLATPDLEEYTPVFFRVFKDTSTHKPKVHMCSDARPSSLNQDKGPLPKDRMYKPSFAGFVDGRISLRSLIDHSIVESFGALGKTVITSRVYPVKAVQENAHLYVFNNGTQTVNVESLNARSIESPLHMNDGAL
ncbi:unnamed protein product [Arabis nemorensis]|uniref:Glycosyl hydrolase family 32 N-terminal domain-containing protein n=1 Tax=Arabis nemorensis TaxID=586526 RepID=A0A565AZ57_9BRAS|nr:unnamed protein product [Arabis nemorensis]